MSNNHAKFLNRQEASLRKIYFKHCPICQTGMLMAKNQKYCSPQCKGKVKYVDGSASTENQYKKISGNWSKYLQKLLYFHGRYKEGLTLKDLLELLEKQQYKCALSGEKLTCLREKGTQFWANASIDRIIAGGAYSKDNIQLVCRSLNGLRRDMSVNEFINWCNKVVDYNKLKTNPMI